MRLDFHCKAGKIQLTDEGVLQVKQAFGKVLWQAPEQNITGFAAQPASMGSLNITIYSTTDVFSTELVSQANYAKLQAAFPHLQSGAAGQAWYLNQAARSHVATYTDTAQMQREIEAAMRNGWTVTGQSGQSGHVSARKMIAGGILAGGVGALAGAGRSKDTITVTFVRQG